MGSIGASPCSANQALDEEINVINLVDHALISKKSYRGQKGRWTRSTSQTPDPHLLTRASWGPLGSNLGRTAHQVGRTWASSSEAQLWYTASLTHLNPNSARGDSVREEKKEFSHLSSSLEKT